MRIPSKNLGAFAHEIYSACTASRSNRLQRGAMFRNLYLTGSEEGVPATYPEIYAFIDNLSSFLYSPVEIRFSIDCYGAASPLDRAKMRAASSEFHKEFRRSNADTLLDDAVTWSLVKGKTFIKNSWTSEGFRDVLVQPEMMGVLEENLRSLDEQDAFCHTTYLTSDRLWRMLKTNPNRDALMQKAMKYASRGAGDDSPGNDSNLRQIVVGGSYPYSAQGVGGGGSRGEVRWLEAPTPQFDADVVRSMIPVHELWIWDDEKADDREGIDGDYTTIQFIGEDVILAGELTRRNIFADQYSPFDKGKGNGPSQHNPLSGHHPFSEVCPNQLDGYFWGRSELCNVALLQKCINARVDGINQMLRRQEDPPKFFSGVSGIKQQAYSIMKKAGGYFTDSNPGAKVQDMYPQLPDKIFESLHEFQAMFDRMAGFTATMSGRGESGVRSQGHSETLTKNASPRFKDRALLLERQIEAMGSLKLAILKAKVPESITAWVPKADAGIEGEIPPTDWLEAPPVKGMVPVEFSFYDLPENSKVTVDSHSSSPAFGDETKRLMFDLFKVQAIDQESLIQHLHPPGADSMLESLERKRVQHAELLQAHPELIEKEAGKSKKK